MILYYLTRLAEDKIRYLPEGSGEIPLYKRLVDS